MPDPLALSNLLPDGWQTADFGPFRDGVQIKRLWPGQPEVALLKYAPGASVPRHRHTGLETILVLSGSQSDERGLYRKGDLVMNPEGSIHSVQSEEGCVILIQWERPVEILDEDQLHRRG